MSPILILVFLLLDITAGQTTDKQMLCQEFKNLFARECQTGLTTLVKVPGPAGKRGPKGPEGDRGAPGVQGKAGVCDYQKVEQLVRREVKKDMDRMESEMREMAGQLAKINSSLLETKKKLNSWCDYGAIEYNGSCLWAEKPPSTMTVATALQTCNDRTPSKLPEIYGETEYLKIMGYLRSKIPIGQKYIFAWTGMTRDHSTGKAVLSNGETAPYTKPRSNRGQWTGAEARRTHVYLFAKPSSSDSDNGMGAIWSSYAFPGQTKIVLCQKI